MKGKFATSSVHWYYELTNYCVKQSRNRKKRNLDDKERIIFWIVHSQFFVVLLHRQRVKFHYARNAGNRDDKEIVHSQTAASSSFYYTVKSLRSTESYCNSTKPRILTRSTSRKTIRLEMAVPSSIRPLSLLVSDSELNWRTKKEDSINPEADITNRLDQKTNHTRSSPSRWQRFDFSINIADVIEHVTKKSRRCKCIYKKEGLTCSTEAGLVRDVARKGFHKSFHKTFRDSSWRLREFLRFPSTRRALKFQHIRPHLSPFPVVWRNDWSLHDQSQYIDLLFGVSNKLLEY